MSGLAAPARPRAERVGAQQQDPSSPRAGESKPGAAGAGRGEVGHPAAVGGAAGARRGEVGLPAAKGGAAGAGSLSWTGCCCWGRGGVGGLSACAHQSGIKDTRQQQRVRICLSHEPHLLINGHNWVLPLSTHASN